MSRYEFIFRLCLMISGAYFLFDAVAAAKQVFTPQQCNVFAGLMVGFSCMGLASKFSER